MAIQQIPRTMVPVSTVHTVVPGQTLQDVAMVHDIDPGGIMHHPRNRHVTFAGPLTPGTRLFIPGKSGVGNRLG